MTWAQLSLYERMMTPIPRGTAMMKMATPTAHMETATETEAVPPEMIRSMTGTYPIDTTVEISTMLVLYDKGEQKQNVWILDMQA